jgi:hypothetical protein
MDAFTPPREAHYARLCAYLKAHLAEASIPSSDGVETTDARGNGRDSMDVQHIERQLAHYIGPLARHLVKKAASLARGPDDLIARLVNELDTEPERRAFEQRCRQYVKRGD